MDQDGDTVEILRARLYRLEAAVEASGLGVWEWNVRTGEVIWNRRNRELFGVDHDRPLTIQDYAELVHPEDREAVRAAYREAADRPEGGAFVYEHRTVRSPDGRARWLQARGRVVKDSDGVLRTVGAMLDITDRKTAEERRSLVLRELAHRSKNGILVMMTLVAQTAKNARDVRDFEAVLTARLQSLADSQDLVTDAAGHALRLTDLLDRALTPFDPSRFDIDPRLEAVGISNDMVVAMALLLHELGTNAVKYGALSSPSGRVRLTLDDAAAGEARLLWIERGGPPVKPAVRRGFGSRLLEISLRNDGGAVEARFEPAGFEAHIRFPVEPA
ncbi:MAG: sensor histidine kinase [Pseudomonadota bacterium]